MSNEYFRTYIEGFDEIFENSAIPRATTVVIYGPMGSGKTTFVIDYLMKGILVANELGILVTLEEPARNILRDYANFKCWNLTEHIRNSNLLIIDLVSARMGYGYQAVDRRIRDAKSLDELVNPNDKIIYLSNPELLITLINKISEIVGEDKMKTARLALDSLTAYLSAISVGIDVVTRAQFWERIREKLLTLRLCLEGHGITSFVTAEALSPRKTRFGIEEFIARGAIYLGYEWLGRAQRRRYLVVMKMRGVKHKMGRFSFEISPEFGVRILGEVI